VRDLESVLIQLAASASLLGRPIDLELTEAALRKLAPERDEMARLDVRTVIDVVARFFQTTPEAMASRSRRRDVLQPRQLAMYLCRRYTDASHGTIGHAFGRDHPSVRNAVVVIERRILERAPLRYRVEALCSRLEELQRQRAR
jgi:chromosomal replication initiator protein